MNQTVYIFACKPCQGKADNFSHRGNWQMCVLCGRKRKCDYIEAPAKSRPATGSRLASTSVSFARL